MIKILLVSLDSITSYSLNDELNLEVNKRLDDPLNDSGKNRKTFLVQNEKPIKDLSM
jgi:hypothetical protein